MTRPESPDRPDDAEEQLEERLEAALEELDEDDDVVTDGGVVVGFLDEAWPRPTDNSRRLWAFERPTLAKATPTASFEDVVFGFYALTGASVVECKDDLRAESVADFFPQHPPEKTLIGRSSSSAITFPHILPSIQTQWENSSILRE